MNPNHSLAGIAAALRAHQRFVILSHVRPDGDAIGSQIALALSLRELGKEVTLWNQDGCMEKLRFLPGTELFEKTPEHPRPFDVVIALDTGTQERLGLPVQSIAKTPTPLWINLDHHISNHRFGDLVHVDPDSPATGQIIFELLKTGGFPITPAIADNLWAAIATDTGSFQYSNTTARTFEIGAELIQAGVNVGKISERLFQSYPRRRLELLRELLNTLKSTCEGQVASFALTLDAIARTGVTPDDTEGLIDTLRAIDGVLIAAFFEELPEEGKIRVSLRSKDPRYNVCDICAQFGGGGHPQAAGARLKGPLADAETRVLDAVCNAIHTSCNPPA